MCTRTATPPPAAPAPPPCPRRGPRTRRSRSRRPPRGPSPRSRACGCRWRSGRRASPRAWRGRGPRGTTRRPRGRGRARAGQAPVGEGVRGPVEDPHDPRAVQDALPRPVLPRARLRHEAAIRRCLFSPLRGRGTLYPGRITRPRMRVLFLHTDYLEYEVKEKALKGIGDIPEDRRKGRVEEALAVFVSGEEGG